MAVMRIKASTRDQRCRDALKAASSLRQSGQHLQAINFLNLEIPLMSDQSVIFTGLALALKARSQVQLMDDAGAMLTINHISESLRRLNPQIDSYCNVVKGTVERRRAYCSWKAGRPAIKWVDLAIESFSQAQGASENGLDERWACVAKLNQIYASGLKAAMTGFSKSENPALLRAAIITEATARDSGSIDDSSHLSGLVIIADLAIGANLLPSDIYCLSALPSFTQACQRILSSNTSSWAQELLQAATVFGAPPLAESARIGAWVQEFVTSK
jgi:hypothetical protein